MANHHPSLGDILFNEQSNDFDAMAHTLWYDGFVHHNANAYDNLVEYLDWEYGIDFEAAWSWDLYPPS